MAESNDSESKNESDPTSPVTVGLDLDLPASPKLNFDFTDTTTQDSENELLQPQKEVVATMPVSGDPDQAEDDNSKSENKKSDHKVINDHGPTAPSTTISENKKSDHKVINDHGPTAPSTTISENDKSDHEVTSHDPVPSDIDPPRKNESTHDEVTRPDHPAPNSASTFKRNDSMIAITHHRRNPAYDGVIFFGDPIVCSVTSDGGTIPDESVNAFIRVQVPQGAVPEGQECSFTLHPCLSGPFVPPNGCEFKSPIFLIECDSKLEREVQVMMNHYADLQHEIDCNQMCFVYADSKPTIKKKICQYIFHPCSSSGVFSLFDKKCSISIAHFSFFGVCYKIIRSFTRNRTGQNLYQFGVLKEPPSSETPPRKQALLYFSVDSDLYIQDMLESLQDNFTALPTTCQNLHVSNDTRIIYLLKQDTLSGWHIDTDPDPPEVRLCEINNPKCWPHYPPRLTMNFEPNEAEPTVTVTRDHRTKIGIHGFLEMENKSFSIELTYPVTAGRGRYILNGSDLRAILRQMSEAAVDWKNIGIQLGYSRSHLDGIERMHSGGDHDDYDRCLTEMLAMWLTSNPAPSSNRQPTIIALADALTDCDYSRLASEVREEYSQMSSHPPQPVAVGIVPNRRQPEPVPHVPCCPFL